MAVRFADFMSMRVLFTRNFAVAKFCENKSLMKIVEFTVLIAFAKSNSCKHAELSTWVKVQNFQNPKLLKVKS